MHEMSLIRPVVEIVVDTCAQQDDVKAVKKVYLTVGEMRDVIEAYVPGLFRFLAKGTVAENAEVVIRKVPLTVQCNACHEIFPIDIHDDSTWKCPRCGAYQNYSLFSGQEFRIDGIEVERTQPYPVAV